MSRDAILMKLRQNRGECAVGAATHIVPKRARISGADGVATFVEHLESHGVCVERLAKADLVPSVVQRYLQAARKVPTIRMGHDPRLASLPWQAAAGLTVQIGRAAPNDLAAISYAVAGITETGTLVLVSGPDNPTTLAFLPDVHFIVIHVADVYGSIEEAFKSAPLGPSAWPRSVNLISAASRTGDIGGQLVMGAHGPRQLVVLIVGTTPAQ
jgi:L-lactate dehydrogenase complex protein LldG